MILALTYDPTFAGIFFVVALILFVLAALNVASKIGLVAAGLAFCALVWAWQNFAAA